MSSFQDRFLQKRFSTVPSHWEKYEVGEFLWERKDTSSDISRFPLYSLTIENGVTEKTEQYERSFLLKDKDSNEYRLVYPEDVVYNPMNLRFGAIAVSKIDSIVSVSAYYNVLEYAKDKCDINYLESLLKSFQIMDLYDRIAIGSLIEKRRVHLSEFIKLKVYLPPLPEQKKIASILGTWDQSIEVLEKLIETKQKRKKGLMQKLLVGKIRLKKYRKPSAIKGVLPKKWKSSSLGNLVHVIFSNVDKKTYTDQMSVFLCNYLDVYNNFYITQDMDFMKATASRLEIDKFALQKDDVLITKDSETPDDIAKPATVTEKLENVVCGYHLGILRPKENKVSGLFLGQLLMLPSIRHQFSRIANGATRYGLNLTDIKKVPLHFPSNLDEQNDIARILIRCDKEIAVLKQKAGLMKQQKKGLMQKLLTGKVRVKV